MPNTFQEISPQSPSPQLRLRLNSQNNEWGINFANYRIDIEKNPVTANGNNIGNTKDFIDEATDFISRILNHFNKEGHRVSLITSGFLQQMSDEQLDSIYNKLFNPLPFYNEEKSFEWNYRSVAHSTITIEDHDEKINVITNINRVRGQLAVPQGITVFDRIEVMFDINTIAEEDKKRFSATSLKDFFENALDVRDTILNQIGVIINE